MYLHGSQVAVGQGRTDKIYKVQWVVARLTATTATLAQMFSATAVVSGMGVIQGWLWHSANVACIYTCVCMCMLWGVDQSYG